MGPKEDSFGPPSTSSPSSDSGWNPPRLEAIAIRAILEAIAIGFLLLLGWRPYCAQHYAKHEQLALTVLLLLHCQRPAIGQPLTVSVGRHQNRGEDARLGTDLRLSGKGDDATHIQPPPRAMD